jgi:AcrR family transcriptional regulator
MLKTMTGSRHRRPPATAPTRRKAPRERLDVDERRAQLVALGLELFGQQSYEDVSVDALAKAAGVSKGLLYYYFPTKRDLYVAALAHASGKLLEETRTDPALRSGERVTRGLQTYLDFVDRHGPAYVALMRGGLGSDSQVAAILEQTRRTFVDRVAEGMPPAAVTPLVLTALRGWIGFVEATALDWAAHRAVPKEALVSLLSDLLFATLGRATEG